MKGQRASSIIEPVVAGEFRGIEGREGGKEGTTAPVAGKPIEPA